jgi:hypothetical protein
MLVRSLACTLALAAATLTARADDCPTRETALAGFVAEMPDGKRFSVRSTTGPLVESTLFAGKDRAQSTTYFEGFFPLESITGTRVLQLKPPGKLAEFFPLKVGAKAEMTATPTVNGTPGKPWSISLEVLDERPHMIGGCPFKIVRIARRIVEEGGNVVADLVDYFSPDLRFVIAREVMDKEGKPRIESYKRIRARGRTGTL